MDCLLCTLQFLVKIMKSCSSQKLFVKRMSVWMTHSLSEYVNLNVIILWHTVIRCQNVVSLNEAILFPISLRRTSLCSFLRASRIGAFPSLRHYLCTYISQLQSVVLFVEHLGRIWMNDSLSLFTCEHTLQGCTLKCNAYNKIYLGKLMYLYV